VKVFAILLAVVAVVLLAEPSMAKPALPPADVQAAAKDVAAEYRVPLMLLYAILTVETGGTFKTKIRGRYHGGNDDTWRNSYRRYRAQTIRGSAIKWGDKFKLDDWRAYGIAQVHPVNLWGVVIPADAPLEAGLDTAANLRAGALVLRKGYDKGKTWIRAIGVYNSKSAFRDKVLRVYRAFGGTVSVLEGGNS
jgi:hypothetical protein